MSHDEVLSNDARAGEETFRAPDDAKESIEERKRRLVGKQLEEMTRGLNEAKKLFDSGQLTDSQIEELGPALEHLSETMADNSIVFEVDRSE